MKDTTAIEALRIITKNDTITLQVDKSLIGYPKNEKSIDTIQILAIILPVIAALLTLIITKWFDNIAENKKYKNQILKDNREQRVKILKDLNELRTSFHKTRFTNPELEDFYEWTADRVIGVNPFHDLKINSNILFGKDIVDVAENLYYTAENINRNYNLKKREHPSDSINLGGQILKDIDKIIDKISQNLTNE